VLYGTGTAIATARGPVGLAITPTRAGLAAMRAHPSTFALTVDLSYKAAPRIGSTTSRRRIRHLHKAFRLRPRHR
jgi:hypothetical protein